MTGQLDQRAADRILRANVRVAIDLIRNGELARAEFRLLAAGRAVEPLLGIE